MRPQSWIFVVVMLAATAASRRGAVSAADETGSLRVESEPAGAVVYVDGRTAGATPLTVAVMTAGVHRVRLVRTGYLENTRLVTIKGGTRASLRAQLDLRIVVLRRRRRWDIIQQKTAVAPVVDPIALRFKD